MTGEDTPSANASPVKVNVSPEFTKTTPPSLVSHRLETLGGIGDLDYLTHIVFRMYECFDVPAEDPNRFRIEILSLHRHRPRPVQAERHRGVWHRQRGAQTEGGGSVRN